VRRRRRLPSTARRKYCAEKSWVGAPRTAAGRRASLQPEEPDHRAHEGLEARHDSLGRQAIARLAGDDDLVPLALKGAAQQRFALSLAVHVGGVEEVDARVTSGREEVEEDAWFSLEDPADARRPGLVPALAHPRPNSDPRRSALPNFLDVIAGTVASGEPAAKVLRDGRSDAMGAYAADSHRNQARRDI
jgi:hypothetical protein